MKKDTESVNREFFNQKSSSWDNHNTKSYDVVFNNIKLNVGDKVLDVGCGTGILDDTIYSLTNTRVYGIDISNEMLKIAKEKHKDIDVTYINESFYDYNSSGFDKIIIYNAYPHFVLLNEFKDSIYRNLNKDGEFIICHSLSRKELDNHHHGMPIELSRNLKEVNLEADFYKDLFEIVYAYEDDKSYVIKGKKK